MNAPSDWQMTYASSEDAAWTTVGLNPSAPTQVPSLLLWRVALYSVFTGPS